LAARVRLLRGDRRTHGAHALRHVPGPADRAVALADRRPGRRHGGDGRSRRALRQRPPPMTLSVVLIARNQARNLDRLVQSVLREAPGAETVLVDSRSTDETVERALEYPIRVLRLREGSALSPAAGRYVGFHATS